MPAFLKSSEAYKRGDFEQALRDAFIGFDSKLLGPEVIEELKMLAGDKYGYGEDDGPESDSDEDLNELKQEGGMPIEEVLTKYKNAIKGSALNRLIEEETGGGSSAGGSSSSTAYKPHSPCLRGKKPGKDSENGGDEAAETPSGSASAEAAVSSSSVKEASSTAETATASKPMESPDSSSTDANKVGSASDEVTVEGSSSSSSSSTVVKGNDVSSSSSSAAEAGGSSTEAAGSTVNGSGAGISSSNVERAAKRVALALSQPTAATPEDSDESEEDERDMTYDENNSTEVSKREFYLHEYYKEKKGFCLKIIKQTPPRLK